MKRWSPEEVDFLLENYGKLTTRQMAEALGRDYSTTKRKVKAHILNKQEDSVPDNFVRIDGSPIHAVNKFGQVIRIKTRKTIKPSANKKGYLQVCLQDKKSYRIHRLVAQYFVPNELGKSQVNHIDGDKENNDYRNLEWVTDAENREHAIRTGLWDGISSKISTRQTGQSNSRAKLNESDIKTIYNLLRKGVPVGRIADRYNVNHANICAIKTGRSWKHLYHLYKQVQRPERDCS